MPSVAVAGDVVATPSPATTLGGSPPAPGAWTAGPVIDSTYAKLTVGGKPVVWQASCTFTFTDSNTGATVPVPVTLTASTTSLQGGLTNVLLAGDSVVVQGNRLEVRTTPPDPLTAGVS